MAFLASGDLLSVATFRLGNYQPNLLRINPKTGTSERTAIRLKQYPNAGAGILGILRFNQPLDPDYLLHGGPNGELAVIALPSAG